MLMADILVTVVVPVKNEEQNLAQCLSRLGRFAHIIVVDSGSDDRTSDIAEEYGAELIQFRWSGGYPKKRNWVLINYHFTTPWVLFLDADELINDAFCDELQGAILDKDKVGFWLNYTSYFLGRKLSHGIPQRKLALIRAGSGLYERIEEESWSQLDMEIHEHPVLDGAVGEISNCIEHRDLRGVDRFLSRHIEYAKWEAARYERLHEEGGLGIARHLTKRQLFKYRNIRHWWFPWFYFLCSYIARLGFLDGWGGFRHAFYKARYFETVRALIEEREMSSRGL